jgi:hypothetical protein
MANEQESDSKSHRALVKLLIAVAVVAILPIVFTAPLMDVRFWFTEYVSGMDYSPTNLYELWERRLLPGRFVPISDFYVLIYMYVGHKFLQITQTSLNYFDALTKMALLALWFVAISGLFREISKGFVQNLNNRLWNLYPIILFIVWGLGINIFWAMNGAVAYPILIYTAFIVSILFATATLKNLRVLLITGQTVNRSTVLLIALSSIWANFYYEISYTAIAAIVVAISVAPIANLTKSQRVRLASMFVGAFAIVWLPMRMILKNQCEANLEACYDGSQLNLGGMFGTLIQNIVNPLPFADYDAIKDVQQGRLPFVFSGVVLLVAILIVIAIFSNLRTAAAEDDITENSSLSSFVSAQWRFTLIVLAMGLSSAVILSVSIRAQDLVDWGLSYRHTPILWLGYAALILLGITWLAQKTKPVTGAVALIAIVLLLTTGQWGRSWSAVRDYNEDFEPVSRLYHELYNADLSDSELANIRRCLIVEELSEYSKNQTRYIDPAEKFMNTFHDRDFCKP